MIEEFKKFAFKGNVVDLSVGVILGAAFGNVVKALTDWMIMPFLGLITGGLDFASYYLVLKAPKEGAYANVEEMVTKGGAVVVRWGAFINTVIAFFLVTLAVFFLVKAMNKAVKKKEEEPAPPPPSEVLLGEIRDLLKAAAVEPVEKKAVEEKA